MPRNSESLPVDDSGSGLGLGLGWGPDPMEMQVVVPAALDTTPFELPSDWIVEVRPRGSHSSVSADKYYYEPGTGRKFRSLASIRRYLTGEADPPPTKKPSNSTVRHNSNNNSNSNNSNSSSNSPGTCRRIVYGGKVLSPDELEDARHTNLEDISPKTSQFRLANTLPDGWIVEDVPRKLGSSVRSDRYYIEPTTGEKFRSMPEVQRFLGLQKCEPKRKASTLSNHCKAPRSSLSRKKNTEITTFKDTLIDLMYPPKRINWVYSGDGKDNWSPLVEECVLPNYVTEQWSETFLFSMNGVKHGAPQLTMKEHNQG